MMKLPHYLVFIATLALPGLLFSAQDSQISQFIDNMVEKHGFDRNELTNLMSQARKRHDILEKISRPAERILTWGEYRKIFLTGKRIQGGVEFWQRNREALDRAESVYGVPPEIIVSIIGVETFYGRITGKDKVLDALYTLGFFYPKRSAFFSRELEEFLLLAREENIDPRVPRGSYAGAMGLGQFMPDSYRNFAVDFDGDGKRDIWHNETDAIGSVANYFAQHKWQHGGPVSHKVQLADAKLKDFAKAGMKPSIPIAELRQAGIPVAAELPDDMLASMVELEIRSGMEYWLGLPNFYVITRYNHSNMYAMAVYQLSREIVAARGGKKS